MQDSEHQVKHSTIPSETIDATLKKRPKEHMDKFCKFISDRMNAIRKDIDEVVDAEG